LGGRFTPRESDEQIETFGITTAQSRPIFFTWILQSGKEEDPEGIIYHGGASRGRWLGFMQGTEDRLGVFGTASFP
jgi:hypothetical protein